MHKSGRPVQSNRCKKRTAAPNLKSRKRLLDETAGTRNRDKAEWRWRRAKKENTAKNSARKSKARMTCTRTTITLRRCSVDRRLHNFGRIVDTTLSDAAGLPANLGPTGLQNLALLSMV